MPLSIIMRRSHRILIQTARRPAGTHVSGIAAGRNGHTLDNRPLSGTAPEAQLLFLQYHGGVRFYV